MKFDRRVEPNRVRSGSCGDMWYYCALKDPKTLQTDQDSRPQIMKLAKITFVV